MACQCWACAKQLESDSIYCKDCEQWQNWRRYFSISLTSLSLITATIAVFTALIPAAVEVLFPKSGDLTIGGILSSGGKGSEGVHYNKDGSFVGALQINASNIGEAPVRLPSHFECKFASSEEQARNRIIRFEAAQGTIVPAGSSIGTSYAISSYGYGGKIENGLLIPPINNSIICIIPYKTKNIDRKVQFTVPFIEYETQEIVRHTISILGDGKELCIDQYDYVKDEIMDEIYRCMFGEYTIRKK